jgi:hypothetical protein
LCEIVKVEEFVLMPILTIAFGGLLLVLGILGYVLTGSQHPTALIPAAFGLAFDLLGSLCVIAPAARKHFMHVAAALGLIGFFGTISGLIGLARWVAGTEPAQPAAVISKSIMSVLCVIFVGLCVRSFIQARRNRQEPRGFEVNPPPSS